MARIDDLVISRRIGACASQGVKPSSTDFLPSLDVDDLPGTLHKLLALAMRNDLKIFTYPEAVVGLTVAGHLIGIYVLDWSVVCGHIDSSTLGKTVKCLHNCMTGYEDWCKRCGRERT